MASEPAIVLSDDSDKEVEEISSGPARQRVSLALYISRSFQETRFGHDFDPVSCRSSRDAVEAKDRVALQALVKVSLESHSLTPSPVFVGICQPLLQTYISNWLQKPRGVSRLLFLQMSQHPVVAVDAGTLEIRQALPIYKIPLPSSFCTSVPRSSSLIVTSLRLTVIL